jgi:hypothetical protein
VGSRHADDKALDEVCRSEGRVSILSLEEPYQVAGRDSWLDSHQVSLRGEHGSAEPAVVLWHLGTDTERVMTLDEAESLAHNLLAEVRTARVGRAAR